MPAVLCAHQCRRDVREKKKRRMHVCIRIFITLCSVSQRPIQLYFSVTLIYMRPGHVMLEELFIIIVSIGARLYAQRLRRVRPFALNRGLFT